MFKTKVRGGTRTKLTSIPSAVAKMLGIESGDSLKWEVKGGKAVLTPVKEDSKDNES